MHTVPSKSGAFCPRSAPAPATARRPRGGLPGPQARTPAARARIPGRYALPRDHFLAQRELAGRPAQQQPVYADPKALERVVAELSRLPPIVVSWEVEALRARLAAAQRGEAFVLQGGDCAETFADCESDYDRQETEDPAADEPGAAARTEKADHARGAHGRAVRQAALGRHRDARRGDAAELPRRSRQPPGIHRRGARRGSGAAAARL